MQESPQAARVKVLASGNATERRFRCDLPLCVIILVFDVGIISCSYAISLLVISYHLLLWFTKKIYKFVSLCRKQRLWGCLIVLLFFFLSLKTILNNFEHLLSKLLFVNIIWKCFRGERIKYLLGKFVLRTYFNSQRSLG